MCLALLYWTAAMPALAQEALRGVALVVGNGGYEHLAPLANPPRDADAIEELLSDLGFDSVRRTDRDADDLARDLERFVEDAGKADVAVLYYAGHGIEAGGENWLIPVDADMSALDAAATELVPVSGVIRRLRETVAVTIVLLDACRDNPFPEGATLKTAANAAPQTVSAGGLAVADTRGASPLAKADTAPSDNLGIVIGFAAAPGQVALDGDAGENSPYAAALARHISAMAGEEFGTVMRMVAEEVYLKTGGRQRPWVNESLRRLLYFGEAPKPVEGAEGDILTERRQLLLSIAALPDFKRKQVERIASNGGVPMDAIFGMLRALGRDAPDDPAELEKLLREQTVRLKEILQRSATLSSTDPEIVRFTRLADLAMEEGAFDSNLRFREAARARFEAIEGRLDQVENEIRERRLEGGDVLAKTADAHLLLSDYLAAADNYRKAFDQVRRWDRRTAWVYKAREANALQFHGDLNADNAGLLRSISAYKEALLLAPRDQEPELWAATNNDLANAMSILGRRKSDRHLIEGAISAYRAALDEFDPDSRRRYWAGLQNNIGVAFQHLSRADAGTENIEQAISTFRLALASLDPVEYPLDWAEVKNNLGNALLVLGRRQPQNGALEEAVAVHREALQVRTRSRSSALWAKSQNNLGMALSALGERNKDPILLIEAIGAFRAALEERTREQVPLEWATIQHNLGAALQELGQIENNWTTLGSALEAYRLALQERTRARVPVDWASTKNLVGTVLSKIGELRRDPIQLEKAIVAYRAALQVRARERSPLGWAEIQGNLGIALHLLGELKNDPAYTREALSAFHSKLEVYNRARSLLDWGRTQFNVALALSNLGAREADQSLLREAAATFQLAMEGLPLEQVPLEWAAAQLNLGNVLFRLALHEPTTENFNATISAYEAALTRWTRERAPQNWAMAQANLGTALLNSGQRRNHVGHLERAIVALRAAQQIRTPEKSLLPWAQLQAKLGTTHLELATRTHEIGQAMKGLDAFEQAIRVLNAAGNSGYDEFFKGKIAEARSTAAQLR